MALVLIVTGAALIFLACLAVAWPWIRMPRVSAETRTTIAECVVAAFTGTVLFAAAVAGGLL